MAKPMDAEEKKHICDRFASGETLTQIQKATGRAPATIRKALRQGTPDMENSIRPRGNIEAYMNEKTPEVCRMIDLYLGAMCSPEKIEDATLSQLSHAFSSVVDKFLKDRGGEQKNVEVSLQVPEPWTK